MFTRLLFLLVFINLTLTSYSQAKKTNLAFLSDSDYKACGLEVKSAWDFLKNFPTDISPHFLTFFNISENPDTLEYFDVVWFHRMDTNTFSKTENKPEVISGIKKYINNGGKLLLTLDAFKYLNILELESNIPQIRWKEAKDDGYGRKLGFHSFLSHPVFKGLHGGAYVYKPVMDIEVRQIGYFDDILPAEGKVVAVDWDYIFLRENKKMILEYDYGNGQVLAIGSYIYFAAPNYNHRQLKKFMFNCINYLDSKIKENKYYWNYSNPEFIIYDTVTRSGNNFHNTETSQWLTDTSKLDFTGISTSNYFDIASRRMVIMGKENGGITEVWAHPFMAMRDYEAGIKHNGQDSITWLHSVPCSIVRKPGSLSRSYELKEGTLREIITSSINDPVGIVHYEYYGTGKPILFIRLKENFRLMWPYSEKVMGNIHVRFDSIQNAVISSNSSEEFCVVAGSSKKIDSVFIKPAKNDTNEENTYYFNVGFLFKLDSRESFNIVFSASNEGLTKTMESYQMGLNNAADLYNDTKQYYNNFLEESVDIVTPDKNFNKGFRWAKIATDQCFVNTPGIGQSLVAGYATSDKGWWGGHKVSGRPGYAWYFGRDAVWSAFALLDYGDFNKVREILITFQHYQSPDGKIYHELSTSGIVHYDASDATPLFIVLAGEYLKHSGDLDFIDKSWPRIKKAIEFCFSTDTDADHLIENTNVGHGWVEGGSLFGSHTSLYLASCWAKALDNAAYMAGALQKESLAENYQYESEKVTEIINNDFWNKENKYLNHGIFQDGSFHKAFTIMPSIPACFNVVDSNLVPFHIDRYITSDFTSDWGVRIISKNSPDFHPRGYHSGSVWPLYTGWTALAEYQHNYFLQGFPLIMNNLNLYHDFALGFTEEVLHGERFLPSGVCPHQCWSETMVLMPVIEGLLGFESDALNNTVHLKPAIPFNWNYLKVNNLRSGKNKLSFEIENTENILKTTLLPYYKNEFSVVLENTLPPGSVIEKVICNNENIKFSTDRKEQAVIVKTIHTCQGVPINLSINHRNGVSVLPVVTEVSPGDSTSGMRILKTKMSRDLYSIQLEIAGKKPDTLQLLINNRKIRSISGAELLAKKENIFTLLPVLGASGKYNKTNIDIYFKE